MTSSTNTHPSTFVRWPREIAAAVTLRAACAALVAPEHPDDALDPRRAVVVTTACGALATRFALVAFIAARDTPAPRSVRSFDPFRDPTPPALTGTGPAPDRVRVRVAGDRCASAWRHWRADRPGGVDGAIGAAGALALAAWCSWALGSPARALVRAQHALDTWADDPLAALVARSVRVGNGPSWSTDHTGRTGSSTVG